VTTPGRPDVATIVLTSSSWVVDRGEAKEWWEVERDGEWVVAWKHPSAAEVQQTQDSGTLAPGEIWRCTTELRLPVGSRFKCVRSSPRRTSYRDAMDYLKRAKRDKDRELVVSFFRLAANHRKVMERARGTVAEARPKPAAGDAKKCTDRTDRARLERARQQAQLALAEFERTFDSDADSNRPKRRRPASRAREMTSAQVQREADRQLAALRRWERDQAG
jgi:hypothetical protein